MLIAILIVMLSLAVLSLFSERLSKQYHNYILWGTIAVFFTLCMTRPTSYVSDFLNYEKYFYSFDSIKTQLTVEPTFTWICEKVYYAGGTMHTVIYIYALLSIPLKLYSIRKITNETIYLLALLIFASNFFMLHDCEQIRIAAALSFGFYAFYLKLNGNYWWILLVLIGTTFHHTLAVLFIPLLLSPKDLSRAWKIVLCVSIPVSIVLWILHINVIASLPIPYVETRLKAYEYAIAQGQHPDVRVINIMVLFRIVLFYIVMYYYDNIYRHLKSLPLLLFCDALSIASWFSLATMSVIAVRISQLYGIVEIILFACIYYMVQPKWVGKTIVLFVALYFFFQNYIANQFGFR